MAVGRIRMRTFLKTKFSLFTVIPFLNAAHYGIHHRTTADRNLRFPLYFSRRQPLQQAPMRRILQAVEAGAWGRVGVVASRCAPGR